MKSCPNVRGDGVWGALGVPVHPKVFSGAEVRNLFRLLEFFHFNLGVDFALYTRPLSCCDRFEHLNFNIMVFNKNLNKFLLFKIN